MCHEGQLHCNAHNNNVVVVAPGLGPEDSYLAYLDLDMAFDDETYVDTWKTGTVGADPAEFDALLVQVSFYVPLHFKRMLLTILTCPPHILTFKNHPRAGECKLHGR